MFKTGVEQMITILDEIATESDIGKIYMEVKERPRFIIENILYKE